MAGYNITCDPGDLYSRKCYVTTSSGQKQEIIGYDSAGNPISKGTTSAAGTAWQPNLTVLDQDGNPYQPYGSAGLPFTLSGIAGIFGITPSSGADPQDWKYITESAPGSYSRKMYNQRVCNPLWNTQGCKTTPTDNTKLQTAPQDEPPAASEAWYEKYFGWFSAESESEGIDWRTVGRSALVGGLAAVGFTKILDMVGGNSHD